MPMKRLALAIALTCIPVLRANAADAPCGTNNGVSLNLIAGQKADAGHSQEGVFELSNHRETPVVFDTIRVGGTDTIGYPEAYVEVKGAQGEWKNALFRAPGSFALQPDRLTVKPNGKARFKADLTVSSKGEVGAIPESGLASSRYRLVVHSLSPFLCVVSEPFSIPPP
jgi:hypothetical protein